ncbi:MAG: type II toxin-antitoxin system RelE/ParE family toxin [bacterium]|jgi:phage-related protein
MGNEEWQINFFKHNNRSPVEEWLNGLPVDTRSKILRHIELLKNNGLSLKEPFVKHIKDKIYELRTRDKDGIYRVLYFLHSEKTFMLLHGFVKKTDKTPGDAIKIAENRMKEIINKTKNRG